MNSTGIKRVYATAILLATGLFTFHTWVLFETALALSYFTASAVDLLGVHLGGPALILSIFLILFLVHLCEAGAWAFFFHKLGSFKSFTEAMYFCGTSLTALGYGDLTLKHPWRNLGPIMATNGILLFGCSTAFLFLVIQKIWMIIDHLP